jgi:hypothetical protein
MKFVILLVASFAVHAAEPWQGVLILNEYENVTALLDRCEFKGTVAVSGVVSNLTRRLAEEALTLGANAVQIARTVETASSLLTGTRGVANGRAFLCKR